MSKESFEHASVPSGNSATSQKTEHQPVHDTLPICRASSAHFPASLWCSAPQVSSCSRRISFFTCLGWHPFLPAQMFSFFSPSFQGYFWSQIGITLYLGHQSKSETSSLLSDVMGTSTARTFGTVQHHSHLLMQEFKMSHYLQRCPADKTEVSGVIEVVSSTFPAKILRFTLAAFRPSHAIIVLDRFFSRYYRFPR